MSCSEVDLSCSDNIRVVVRCRPQGLSEAAANFVRCEDEDTISVQVAPGRPVKKFQFDFVADEDSSQEVVYEQAGRPVVDCVLAGFHGAIFAYGQTGTGKTWSTSGPAGAERNDVPDVRGVIPRACAAVFSHVAENSSADVAFKVRASYLEIYNEKIRDLLADPRQQRRASMGSPAALGKGLYLREAASGEVLVEGGRKWVDVTSEEQCVAVLAAGMSRRSVGATAMNSESSRSHAIFTLELCQTSAETMKERKSQLHLVDLAGSERQKSTHAEGERLKESAQINKSLTSLGNVIQALVDASQKTGRRLSMSHVPYRDSKLTFLLKDALGGNSKTCLIATVSPAEGSISETSSTLEFAKRCSAIKNDATINEELTSDAQELQEEVRRLTTLVHHLEDSGQIEAGISKRYDVRRPSERHEVVQIVTGRVDLPSTLEEERSLRSETEKAMNDVLERERGLRSEAEKARNDALERERGLRSEAEKSSNEEKAMRTDRLQAITADALAREETAKMKLAGSEAKFAQLLSLVKKQEEMTAALRSVVELKDDELFQHLDGSWTKDAGVKSLRREIELTKVQRDNHPEITRLAIELSQSRANEVKHEIQGHADFEKQLGILSRELEAALVENGALRELATPGKAVDFSVVRREAPVSSREWDGRNEREVRGLSVIAPSLHVAPGGLQRKFNSLPKPRESQPNNVNHPVVSRQESRTEKVKDLLSTLKRSVYNLEGIISTATNIPSLPLI